uniref:Uncharacterized protein n=1 Tax=Mycena chlorophos TaxID=658473 RepID=A0ABQ0LXI1_MYCCL|nr:predicted protein [Mycena chlorophos]
MGLLPATLFIWSILCIDFVNGVAPGGAVFGWQSVPEMSTCEAADVSWFYGGGGDQLYITITNNGVAQQQSLSATTTGSFTTKNARGFGGYAAQARRADVSMQISGSIPASNEFYSWSQVNVSSGWYVLIADLPATGTSSTSSAFFVADGTDTSCLTGSASSSTASQSTSPALTSTSSSASTSSTNVVLPVDGSSSSKVNRGAIAGGVIGGLAVIAALIAAYFYFRYAATASSGCRKRTRKWNGLTSTDSKAGGGAVLSGRHNSQSESIAPIVTAHDTNVYVIGNVGIDSRPSRINADDDGINSFFSPSQEKVSSPGRSPFSDSGHDDDVPMDLITPLPGNTNVTRNSSTSTSSHMSRNNFSRPRSHPSSPYASPTATESPFSNEAYPPSSPSPVASSSPPRRSSQGEAIGRRIARKAVPQYNPADPSLASASAIPESESTSSLEGAPKLAHQSSFGEGKPMHYLMPDMPPPQRG